MHPEFAPIAFFSALSVLIVLPWHWRAGNIATLAIAFWLFISNIIYGVDALIWGDNVDIRIPVWCDITSKLIIGTNFALPSACLCICIHLERVASVRLAKTSALNKRRRQIFETLMCFGLPLFFMGLHYVVQGHRFDIIEEYGCRPTTYFSIPSLFIVWLPPLLASIAALVCAGLALRHFMLRRISFATHLDASQSALTTSRYLRLMLMSALQMVWSLTITAYALWFTIIAVPIRPWTTWADVHSNFSRIDSYPTAFTPQIIVTGYYVLWWMVPVSTLIFVAFFAFGQDAVSEYKKCFSWFCSHILRQRTIGKPLKSSFAGAPTTRLARDIPISIPRFIASTNATTSTLSSPPLYKAPVPPSPSQYGKSLEGSDYDTHSDISPYDSGVSSVYPDDPKINDLSSSTVLFKPSSPPAPLTPPPPPHWHLRADARNQSPISPHPYTYSSHNGSHREINVVNSTTV